MWPFLYRHQVPPPGLTLFSSTTPEMRLKPNLSKFCALFQNIITYSVKTNIYFPEANCLWKSKLTLKFYSVGPSSSWVYYYWSNILINVTQDLLGLLKFNAIFSQSERLWNFFCYDRLIIRESPARSGRIGISGSIILVSILYHSPVLRVYEIHV